MILCVIDREETVRYGELRRSVYGITNTMLANSLKEMEEDPLVLEFLGLEDKYDYSETELETRIINHLQEFLMEMGKGFTL